MSDDLKKGFKDIAAGALAMAGVAAGSAIHTPSHPPSSNAKHIEASKPEVNLHAPTVEAPETKPEPEFDAPKFDPDTLAPELVPIAHIESSFGQNMAHAAHSKGDYHTAYGALGFKPVSGHDEYLHSKGLQKLFPHLNNADQFVKEFKDNPQFYNAVAAHHWNRLKKMVGGDTNKAAFAWRWGQGAAGKADDVTVQKDPYVQKYNQINQTIFHKSEDYLVKAQQESTLQAKQYNYDHLLSPKHINEGYSMVVNDHGDGGISADVLHNGKHVGSATGTNSSGVNPAKLSSSEHTGKGLGSAMHSAIATHAKEYHSTTTESISPNRTSKSYDFKYESFQKNVQDVGIDVEIQKLEHYSHIPNLTQLDPKFQGTGLVKGLERSRPNRPPRVYVYKENANVESAVDTGSYKYTVTLARSLKLYDLAKDRYDLLAPTLIKSESGTLFTPPDLDEVEQYLIDNGFDGYYNYNSQNPDAVALFVQVPCKRA